MTSATQTVGIRATGASRYQLYSGWFSPWAHRCTLVVALAGIEQAVSVSYVGPDRGFAGQVSVPTFWEPDRIATDDHATLDVELATRFQAWSRTGLELYPDDLRGEIDQLEGELAPALNRGVQAATGTGEPGRQARRLLVRTLADLDATLAGSQYLLGGRLTLADLRLWVTLVRYDVGDNVAGRIGPRLSELPSLWAYARELFQQDEFRATTDLSSFTAAGAQVPDWEAPVIPRPGVFPRPVFRSGSVLVRPPW